MKHISFALLTIFLIITCCSCSENPVHNGSEMNFPNINESTDSVALMNAASDLQPEVSKNEPQTFTKDFDGIIMTVTTDKSRYQLDELIHVEATVKNTTDEKICLLCVDSDSYAKIRTRICSNIGIYLIDIDTFMKDFDDAIDIVTINPNEEYTKNTVFETYTGVDTSSRRLAETGLCLGENTILLLPDPTDVSGNSNTPYSLAFTLILE